jgi:hypothetical protein
MSVRATEHLRGRESGRVVRPAENVDRAAGRSPRRCPRTASRRSSPRCRAGRSRRPARRGCVRRRRRRFQRSASARCRSASRARPARRPAAAPSCRRSMLPAMLTRLPPPTRRGAASAGPVRAIALEAAGDEAGLAPPWSGYRGAEKTARRLIESRAARGRSGRSKHHLSAARTVARSQSHRIRSQSTAVEHHPGAGRGANGEALAGVGDCESLRRARDRSRRRARSCRRCRPRRWRTAGPSRPAGPARRRPRSAEAPSIAVRTTR